MELPLLRHQVEVQSLLQEAQIYSHLVQLNQLQLELVMSLLTQLALALDLLQLLQAVV